MEAILAQIMGLAETGAPGRVHGGVILRLCDEAAGVAAARHSHTRVVTAGVDRVSFVTPVYVGEVLTVHARVNAVWRTSAEVGVRVTAEPLDSSDVRHVLSAYFTMVAVDADGAPAEIPQLADVVIAANPHAQRREREANLRREGRLAEREALIRGARRQPTPEPAETLPEE
jgi:acyl-CoA hydrolase